MAVTITGNTLLKLLNDPEDVTVTQGEIVTDQSIDMINGHLEEGKTLSNMSGAAGSKTLSASSRERGIIMMVAKLVYQSFFKQWGSSAQLGSAGSTTSDPLSNSAVLAAVKEAAELLVESEEEEIEVAVG